MNKNIFESFKLNSDYVNILTCPFIIVNLKLSTRFDIFFIFFNFVFLNYIIEKTKIDVIIPTKSAINDAINTKRIFLTPTALV